MLSSVEVPRQGDCFRHSSAFANSMEYSDESNNHPTTITTCGDDFGFKGPVASIKFRYKELVDYSSGYCIVQTPKTKTKYDLEKYPDRDMAYIALLDVATFLRYFADPVAVAATIERRAREVMQRWRKVNGAKDSLGRRRPVDFDSEMSRFSFLDDKDKEQTSVYEYRLSTYGHTEAVKNVPTPRIDLADIKFLIKLKTTVGVKRKADKSAGDFQNDSWAYNVPLPHWLHLLRSPGFAKLVKDTQADVDSYKVQRAALVTGVDLKDDEKEEEHAAAAEEPMQVSETASAG